MKIEQLIVQQLYNTKKVTLQDIGTFTLSPDVAIAFESDKEMVMPEHAVSFEYDKKAKQDDDLIDFIVSHTRKIKPLATSDLESYSILAKQFLNIGKPFPIEGLGVLQKTQHGEYEFIQGNLINARLEAAPALLKEKTEEDISFSTPPRQPADKKWLWIVLLILVAAAGATLYYFLRKDNKDHEVEKVIIPVADTLPKQKDTLVKPVSQAPDTTSKPTVTPAKDYTFRIVIKEYPSKEAAEKAFTKFTTYGHKLLMYPKDSTTYKIAMPFTSPLSDTSRAKDSLHVFFNANTYVEKD